MTVFKKLHTRILLVIFLTTMVSATGLAIITILSQTDRYRSKMEHTAVILARNTAEACAHYLVLDDFSGIELLIRKTIELPNISRIMVSDQQGLTICEVRRKREESTGTMVLPPTPMPRSSGSTPSQVDTGSQLVIRHPIATSATIGWLLIEYDLDDLRTIRNQIIVQSLWVGCAWLAVVMFIIAYLLRRPMKAVAGLAAFARQLPGQTGSQFPVDRLTLETEQLGEALNFASRELNRLKHEVLEEQNNLVGALREKMLVGEELRRLNATLEERIADEVQQNREKDLILMHQTRHAILGELLMNISHQWRQPLNSIGLQIQEMALLAGRGELPPAYASRLSTDIMTQLEGLSHTIDHFRNFYRHSGSVEPEWIIPLNVIRDTLDVLRESYLAQGIELQLSGETETPVNCGYSDFSHSIMSILANGREAILGNRVDNGRITISLESLPDSSTRIRIANNGGQIPENLIEKIFDPYVTTKFQDSGVGLGLFVVRQTIENRLHGTIRVANTNEGVEFVIIV